MFTVGASRITRQPLDGDSESLFAGDCYIMRSMGGGFLNDEFCPGGESGHIIANNTLIDSMVFLLKTLNDESTLVEFVPLLGKMMAFNL